MMTKKLFGVASVTILTGLVMAASASGCSAGTTYVIANDGGPEVDPTLPPGSNNIKDGGKDAPSKPPVDKPDAPFTKADAKVPAGVCPTTDPITGADIDAQLPWKAPPAPVNVCTQANINAMKTLFAAGGSVTFASIKTALGPTCAACAFSPSLTGTQWSVFVEEGTGALDNRTGSCLAQREGTLCGKAGFQFEECLSAACPESDCGAGGVEACQQQAASGACQGLANAFQSACPGMATDADICGNIFGAIANTCSGGVNNTIDTTL